MPRKVRSNIRCTSSGRNSTISNMRRTFTAFPAVVDECCRIQSTTNACFVNDHHESTPNKNLRLPYPSSSRHRCIGGIHTLFNDRWRLIFTIAFVYGLWCSFTTTGSGLLLPGAYAADSSLTALTDTEQNGQQQRDDTKSPGNAPTITEHPLDITVSRNDPVTLNCKANGEPPLTTFWYKDGDLVSTAAEESSSHRVLLSTGALFFLRVQPGGMPDGPNRKNQKSDAGVYWCVAKNVHGEARSKNASLRIGYLQNEFKIRPKNVQAIVGQEAVLECSPPKGYPEPIVSWKKDNRDLRLDENDERRRIVQASASGGTGQQTQQQSATTTTASSIGNLIITDVDSSDAGFYTCVARNMAGTRESSPARLAVYAKPKIIRKPENRTVTEKEDVVIVCKMDGIPQPVIKWRKKWSPPGASSKLPAGRASQLEGNGLRIERVTTSDEGEYECAGQNEAGKADASAYLTVYSPPEFTVKPIDRTVGEGVVVNVDCDAFGNPAPTKFWSREGNQDPLFPGVSSPDRHMEMTLNGTLRIYNVQTSDEGYYVCSALNNIGSSSSKMYLKVVGGVVTQRPAPPLILRGPANQTLPEMSLAILPCSASGRKIPTLMWLKNGRELATDVRYTIDSSGALQLHDLRKSDSGIYTCRVYNDDGEDRWSASLTVAGHTDRDAVFLRMAEPSTFPSAPGQPQPLNVSESSVYLEWVMPKHIGASAIIGYRLHYFGYGSNDKTVSAEMAKWISITGGNGDVASGPAQIRGTRYLIQRLKPGMSYVFVVRAENQHGVSEPSPPSIVIRTKSSGLGVGGVTDPRDADFDLELARTRLTSGQLVQLREVTALNATSVKLSWKIIQHEPLINGYYVRWQAQDERERGGSLNVPGGASASSAVVTNLRPFTTYKFFVRPYYRTVEGTPSNMYDATTKEAAPSMPPTEVQIRLMNLTTLRISWSPPPADSINGILKGYEIVVLGNESNFDRNLTTTERAASVTLFRLITGMTYRVRVAASTNAGVGVFHGEEEVTMDEPTFRRHLALDKAGDARNGDVYWSQSWWFIALLCGAAWLIVMAVICAIFWRCKRSYKKGILMNGGGHRHNSNHHPRFGGNGLPFIKINDGSVAREALWMDHQPEQFYTRGSGNGAGGGVNNATLLMNGSCGGGSMESPPDGNPAMANNFTASTFMTGGGGGGKMNDKRYTELNQMNILANGIGQGQYYQSPATPIYHQVSPPSPTPYATTTLVMNAHRQRLLEQRHDPRLYPNSTLHHRNGQQRSVFDDVNLLDHPTRHQIQQLQNDQDNGLKRAISLRSDQQSANNQLLNGISPPHTDVSYVSSSGGSGSGKLTHRNKQPVLFDFLPPPPAQPPPSGPPAGYESSSQVLDADEEEDEVTIMRNGNQPNGGIDMENQRRGYYAASPTSSRQPAASGFKSNIPTPRMRLKGRQQQKVQELKQRHGQFNLPLNSGASEGVERRYRQSESPPTYEQALGYYEGGGSPTQSDCTSQQVQVDDSPRASFYAGCHGGLDPMESKRSSMLASLATSDDGDNMLHGMNIGGYGPATSSCNSDMDDDQNGMDDHGRDHRRRMMKSGSCHSGPGRRRFFNGGDVDFSERDDGEDDVDIDDVDEDEDEDDYETRFLPAAEFTQALASRSLLNSAGNGSTIASATPGHNAVNSSGGNSPQYRAQPPMGISASTLLTSQHGTKLSPSNNFIVGGNRLNSLPRHTSASSAVFRAGNHRGKGPTDVV